MDEIKANPREGFKNGAVQVKEFLPDLSKRGSGDDISIAALIDVEALKELEPTLRREIAEEEKKSAERLVREPTGFSNKSIDIKG
ncbi:hypothetical protein AGMMS50268_01120 [Spirochaetia bacterium]|nr:hypothetical protein AGMMS50268_01120 [Spirochaetia bacterium]